MTLILKLSIVLVVGIIGGKIAKLLKLPNISGYLFFGLFLGPTLLNFITIEDYNSYSIINELALGVIAFSIGSEFMIGEIKKLGKSIVIITLLEVIGAIFVVFAVMYFLLNQSFVFSIIIASMSAATAPAATLLVIRQYRAYGPLTKTILPVVALDDVFGIMAFGIAIAIAKITTSTATSWVGMVAQPFLEIMASLALGFVLGIILSFLAKKAKDEEEVQFYSIAAVGISSGLSILLNLSPLLTNMVVGAVIVNVLSNSKRVFGSLNKFIGVFYVLFFTLAGASLDLKILLSIGLVGLAYILSRAGGKFIGSYLGCKVTKADPKVTKFLGLALLPQGGISIGLSLIVRQQFPEYATAITTVIMFGVLVYEITGPIFAKIAITGAGEIDGLDRIAQ